MDKYDTLRAETRFQWKVHGNVYAYLEYEGISLHEYYTDVNAVVQLYRNGRRKQREIFGDDVSVPDVSTPDISYGHLSGIGAPLRFPPGDGEVAVERMFDGLAEAVAYMDRHADIDFGKAGAIPLYLDFKRRLQEAFPGEPVRLGLSGQGPVTTAFLLNGEKIFYELYDDPDLLATYLGQITRSENAFHRFMKRDVLGVDPIHPTYAYLADDAAAFVPPEFFPTHVLPFWEEQYRARTLTGERELHCEGLARPQLTFVERMGVDYYDPSISPLLIPPIVTEAIRVPFLWRLASFHLWNMTVQEIADFVYHLVGDGASGTFLVLTSNMSEGENLRRVQSYIGACRDAERILSAGGSREDVRSLASVKSGSDYWNRWTGFKGHGG